MAKKRMISTRIIDSDTFIDLSATAQNLYFHLCLRADDDGFIDNSKSIMRIVGCSDDDLKLLVEKKFLISFDSGVVVIRHWRVHNNIQKDRYTKTIHVEEDNQLILDQQKVYRLKNEECIQNVYKMDTQIRLDKIRLDKIRLEESESVEQSSTAHAHATPTLYEVKDYFFELGGTDTEAERFYDYYTSNGWKVGKSQMKDWKSSARNWHKREKEFSRPQTNSNAWEDAYKDLFGGNDD